MSAIPLATFTWHNSQGLALLTFDVMERKHGNKFNLRVHSGIILDKIDVRLGVEVNNPFDVERMIKENGGLDGLFGSFRSDVSGGGHRANYSSSWQIDNINRPKATVTIGMGDGTSVQVEAKSGGGKCDDVVNWIGFLGGIVVTIGGLILENPWIVATGAGMTITFGGRLTNQGDGFMDPGDGKWQPGVWY